MSLNPLDFLLPSPDVSLPTEFRRGHIVSLSPLRVNLDRDDPSVHLECSTLIRPAMGLRVMVLIFEGRATILGASHGAGVPAPPQFQDWSPLIRATGTNPTMGNSTRTGRYLLDASGRVDFTCTIVLGSTFRPGSGTYYFPLPVPERSGSFWVVRVHLFVGWVGGNGEGMGTGGIEGDGTGVTRVRIRLNDNTANSLSTLSASQDWTAGDLIHISGTYEAAQ